MIKRLKSITSIQKVIHTNRKPVVVLASDFNEYLCKHSMHTPANYLFYEFLANRFLKLWGLNVPDMAIVDINPEHLKTDHYYSNLQPASFNIPTIGFEYLNNSDEVNQLTTASFTSRAKKFFVEKGDLMRIALFDVWMANEDRNQNNFNLLIVSEPNGHFSFYPIDHEMIFNSGNIDKGLVELTPEDSIVTSTLFNALILKHSKRKSVDTLLVTANEYYFCIEKCNDQLDEILQDIPTAWKIDLQLMRSLIIDQMFSKEWKQKAFNHFNHLLKSQQL